MKAHLGIRFSLAVAVFFAAGLPLSADTFMVTNALPNGPGSFSDAVDLANSNGTATLDTIQFTIPGNGPHTIAPTVQPGLMGNLIIDGFTQPGASSNTLANGNNARLLIVLNGSNAPIGTDGLSMGGTNVTIKGLVINGWPRDGIRHFWPFSPPAHSGLVVEGCFIGTDATGSNAVPNGGKGVFLRSVSNCRIGGTNPAARNVISGNAVFGIHLLGGTNTVIQGNFIGTDKSGTMRLGNRTHGIQTDGTPDALIGGSVPGARNVISGNGYTATETNEAEGILLAFSSLTKVQGNYIGLDIAGTNLIGNRGQGVAIDFGNTNMIGGTNVGEGNVIAGNGEDGVFVWGDGTSGIGNAILGNSIYGNGTDTNSTGQIGIDLYSDNPGGVTTNDACDVDVDGGNRFQNFPVLTGAFSHFAGTTIDGHLDSTTNADFLLEFFANDQCNPSGYGEGKMFLGRRTLMAAANCSNGFTATFPAVVADGKFITATASRTLPGGIYETSEFSQCRTNTGFSISPGSTVTQGNDVCFSWTAPGGTTNFVQAAQSAAGPFTTISPPIVLPPGPTVTTNYWDVGARINHPTMRYYRILIQR